MQEAGREGSEADDATRECAEHPKKLIARLWRTVSLISNMTKEIVQKSSVSISKT